MSEKVKPHRLGWLRRRELETYGNVEVWEQPDGMLHRHDPKQGPLMLEPPRPKRAPLPAIERVMRLMMTKHVRASRVEQIKAAALKKP